MPGSGINSAIGNMVAQRAKLSKIRQSVGLEQSAQQRKATATTQQQAPFVDTFDYANHQLDPAKLDKMHQMASDYHYAQDAAASGTPQVTAKPNSSLDKAMAPIASYFKENGRMPNSEELKTHMVKSEAKAQLGRDATPQELELFVAKPGSS